MEHRPSQRVWLVSDHDLLAQTVTRRLRAEGVEVDRAPSGSSAELLDVAGQGPHDLVVLDADHADERDDLHELIDGLRARGLVVVVLTDAAEVGQAALERGASRVVRPDQGAAAFREALGIPARRA